MGWAAGSTVGCMTLKVAALCGGAVDGTSANILTSDVGPIFAGACIGAEGVVPALGSPCAWFCIPNRSSGAEVAMVGIAGAVICGSGWGAEPNKSSKTAMGLSVSKTSIVLVEDGAGAEPVVLAPAPRAREDFGGGASIPLALKVTDTFSFFVRVTSTGMELGSVRGAACEQGAHGRFGGCLTPIFVVSHLQRCNGTKFARTSQHGHSQPK